MKTLRILTAALVLAACNAFAQAPALTTPNEPATVIAAEPAESAQVALEWRVVSQTAITDVSAFVDLNWGTVQDVRPAGLPIEIESLGGATYAVRIQIWAHPYARFPWQFFPPIARKGSETWFLKIRNADGELVTNELSLLVLPREQGQRFQLAQ